MVEGLLVAQSWEEEDRDDVGLIVTEVVQNAIEHGSAADGSEWVRMTCQLDATGFTLDVIDPGTGRDPRLAIERDPSAQPPLDAPRGRGLFLIYRLAKRFERTLVDEGGPAGVGSKGDRDAVSNRDADGGVGPSLEFLTGNVENDRRNVSILFASVADLYGPHAVHEVMQRGVDRAIEVTGAQRGILFLEQERPGEVAPVVFRAAGGKSLGRNQRYSATVVNKVWRSQEPSLTVDTEQQVAALSESMHALRLLSVMGVPLPVQGRSVGVLYVDSTARVKEFTPSDFHVFQALGGLIAAAVENARLLAAKEAQDRLERDMAFARRIQSQLFPSVLPTRGGLDLAAVGRPCEATSGDYYDVIEVDDNRLALVMGDVSGHGFGPALLMASTRAHLRSYLVADPSPLRVMEYVNRMLKSDSPDNAFMSLFLGLLSTDDRTMTYVSGGHNPPLHVDRAGTVTPLPRTGPILGVVHPTSFEVGAPASVAPGEAILFYTDGIFEAARASPPGAPRDMYGEERLEASFRRHALTADSAQTILDGVLHDLDAFIDGHPLDDDVTALVVRGT